jgi:hypothetical protein
MVIEKEDMAMLFENNDGIEGRDNDEQRGGGQ